MKSIFRITKGLSESYNVYEYKPNCDRMITRTFPNKQVAHDYVTKRKIIALMDKEKKK